MNTKTLQKHYDKLQPQERFRAMIAALGRADWDEYHKLGRTAPQAGTYTVRDTHGLLDAWELLAMTHMILQLGNLATFYFLMSLEDTQKVEVKGEYTADESIEKCLTNIVENGEAWRAVCAEYGIDPKDALAALPFKEFTTIGETIANLSLAIGKENVDAPDFESAISDYRNMIERTRAMWE